MLQTWDVSLARLRKIHLDQLVTLIYTRQQFRLFLLRPKKHRWVNSTRRIEREALLQAEQLNQALLLCCVKMSFLVTAQLF